MRLDSKHVVFFGLLLIILFALAIIPFLSSSVNTIGDASRGLTFAELPAQRGFQNEPRHQQAFSCLDFDGGDVPEEASYVVTRLGNAVNRFTDTCTGQLELLEYVCGERSIETRLQRCQYGCHDGACRTQTSTTVVTADCIQASNQWIFQRNNSSQQMISQGPLCQSSSQQLLPRCDAQNMTTYVVQNCPQNTVCHSGDCLALSSFPIDPLSIGIPQQGWGPSTALSSFDCFNTDYNFTLGNTFTHSSQGATVVNHYYHDEIFTPGMRFLANSQTGVVATSDLSFNVDSCQDAGNSIWINEHYCIEAPNGTALFPYPHAYPAAHTAPCPTACVTGPVIPGTNITMDYCI